MPEGCARRTKRAEENRAKKRIFVFFSVNSEKEVEGCHQEPARFEQTNDHKGQANIWLKRQKTLDKERPKTYLQTSEGKRQHENEVTIRKREGK